VASPKPVSIVEAGAIEMLLDAGSVVIAACGGGIPVVEAENGGGGASSAPPVQLTRVEGVVDKDLAAAVLAQQIGAQSLVILTDVDGVLEDFGTASERLIRTMTVDKAEALVAGDTLPKGSMRPKVQACIDFVRATERPAHIGALGKLAQIVQGEAGTTIRCVEGK
jgi:carbamate kinase